MSIEVGEGENPVEFGATSDPKSSRAGAGDPKSKPGGEPGSPG